MPRLCVHLFGNFSVRLDDAYVLNFDAPKMQQLFSYLLLRREHTHSREVLASLLWGDSSTAHSKKNLRQTLWQMQAALTMQSVTDDDRVLRVEAEWVQVNPNADIWLDVAEFEHTFNLSRGQRGEELDADSVQALCSAVELYQGELLEGWYQDWCLYERQRFQNMYLSMLDKLMRYAEAHQEYELGTHYGIRGLRYDRARERSHRQLMRLYYLAGDHSTAMRQYEQCVEALAEELSAQPSRRTVALYEQICADQLHDMRETVVGSSAHRAADDPAIILPQILQRMRLVWNTLVNAEREIQQDIELVERLLRQRR